MAWKHTGAVPSQGQRADPFQNHPRHTRKGRDTNATVLILLGQSSLALPRSLSSLLPPSRLFHLLDPLEDRGQPQPVPQPVQHYRQRAPPPPTVSALRLGMVVVPGEAGTICCPHLCSWRAGLNPELLGSWSVVGSGEGVKEEGVTREVGRVSLLYSPRFP